MIAIDTNVLLRLLVDDPNEKVQARLARQLLVKQGEAWVSAIVLVETLWVLQSRYKLAKNEIVEVIEKLLQHPKMHLENAFSVNEALTVYRDCNAGFADCSVLNSAKQKQLVLYTFDLKLSRLHGAKLVSGKD